MSRNAVPLLAALALVAGCAAPTPPPKVASATPAAAPAVDYGIYLSARFAASEHDLDEASRYYDQSLKSNPDDPSLLVLSFFYATVAGDFDKANALAAEVVAKSPDDTTGRLALAMAALKKNDYVAARMNLAAASKGPFSVLTVSLFDSWAAVGAGDQAAAVNDMKTLASQDGATGLAAFHQALLADYEGHADEADQAYQKALSVDGTSSRVVDAYGRFLERAGRAADAKALYDRFGAENALSPVIRTGLARLAHPTKPDALVRTPQDGVAEGLFGIAASLNDPESTDVSILYLRFALYLRPDLALANILLADRFESLNKYDDAILAYRKVDKDSPYYVMAEVAAAVDESRAGQTDAAIADLKTLTDADPSNEDAWVALGDNYRSSGKFADAVSAYDKAVKSLATLTPRNWTLFYARATAEEEVHDWTAAEADLNQALKLSPNEPDVLNYLGYSWVDQGRRIPEALAMLEKARSLSPYNGYIVDSVGWAYYRLGRYEDAVKVLQQAVLLVPGDATINDHLGDALWQVGQKMDARFQWNHALTFGPDSGEKAEIEQKLLTGPTREKPA